jgi:uncharacterized membrane protein (DUF2068 family)
MAEQESSGKDRPVKVKGKRAPTLYFIIGFKLLKGMLLLLLALGAYSLSDNNLPEEFRHLLEFLHLDPEKKFFTDLADRIANVTPTNVIWLARGTVLYSLFSLVEGVGLIFRISWAGWLAIGESAFFIPIEVFELVHRPMSNRSFLGVFIVLAVNVVIVWYLFQNRERLFHHHKAKDQSEANK